MRNINGASKFLSLVLRHKPETIGITLDKHGWADVDKVLTGMKICKDELDEIVRTDAKGRYEYNNSGDRIRACQGHSVDVDLGLEEVKPPQILYHGTAERFKDGILKEGINRRSRKYVHLSEHLGTAITVGRRHGTPLALEIDAKQMYQDGVKFYLSHNGVWLTEHVDPKYIMKIIHKAQEDTM